MKPTTCVLAHAIGSMSLSTQSLSYGETIYGIAELGTQNLISYDSASPSNYYQ